MFETDPSAAISAKDGAGRWRRAVAFFLLGVTVLAPGMAAAKEAAAAQFIYLGNAGFLLESGAKKVLIDALQGDGIQTYVVLDAIRREMLERAQEPFGHVDLVLATHYHRDHFLPASVVRCLASNPSALFVSTEQAAGEARDIASNNENVLSRIHGVAPEPGKRAAIPVDGIGLEAINLHHGKGSSAQNLGLIVELDGVRILHTGDTQATPAEFKKYGLDRERFQVAFVPFWFLLEPGWNEALAQAELVVAMHVPALNASPDAFGPAGSLAKLKEQLRAADARVIVFDQVLERRSLTLPRSP